MIKLTYWSDKKQTEFHINRDENDLIEIRNPAINDLAVTLICVTELLEDNRITPIYQYYDVGIGLHLMEAELINE